MFRAIHNSKVKALKYVRSVKNLLGCEHIKYAARKFGDEDQQVFFGYYDVSPISGDDSMLLATRARIANRPPNADTVLQVGFYNLDDDNSEFVKVGDTTTWCWQQGCRLQWYPLDDKGKSGTILYNKLVDGHYGSIIQDIKSKKILGVIRRPIYAVSPEGRWGLSLNFSRLLRLRPGYGYVNLPDDTQEQLMPVNDGIWRINMQTGDEEPLFSVADIASLEPLDSMRWAEHYFNHILFNPSGSRFMFLHIWVKDGRRYTRLVTADPDGSQRFALVNEGHVSHYAWKNCEELLCYSTHKGTGRKYHIYRDLTNKRAVVARDLPTRDGHPSYSPDGRFILTDVYFSRLGERRLLLLNLANQRLTTIGSFYSPFEYKGELRCDLHPRWSPSGRYIAFDSAHTGIRAIYLIELE